MDASSTASIEAVQRPWPWGPPGVLFYFVTAVAVLAALDANSRGSLGMFVVGLVLLAVVGGAWAVRFLGTAWTTRLRLGLRDWIRWLAIPLMLGFVFLLTRTDVPSDIRFALSRGAMDRAAADVINGGTTDLDWIGLYPVQDVERISNGMRFLISGSGFIDRFGFAYSSAGVPENVEGADEYEPLGGGWWVWIARFD